LRIIGAGISSVHLDWVPTARGIGSCGAERHEMSILLAGEVVFG
jgi:hypothetical protein